MKTINKLFVVLISDIHFGMKLTKQLFKELMEVFIPYILDNVDKIDMIQIAGDFFHKKINLNESSSRLALEFFNTIVNICKEHDIKLRILQGTMSHDNDQLNNFYHYYNDEDLDIQIIKKCTEIEEFKDIKFLYVPEEYVEDHREYYDKFREKNPNIIIGHGTWDFVAFDNQIIESESSDKTSPIFIYNEWKDNFDLAIFGHIHTRQQYKNKVWYPGSFTRWAHGEEKTKGFLTYEYDLETKEYDVNFIDNDLAREYTSIDLSKLGSDINSLEIEDIVNLANTALNESNDIRLELNGLSEDKLILVKKALASNDNIKIKVKVQNNNLDAEKYARFSYIIERELPLNETLSRYIREEFDKDLSIDVIDNLLS